MAQLASAIATFSLHSNVDIAIERLALGGSNTGSVQNWQNFCTYICIGKNGTRKWHNDLTGTYSNKISYLNSVSESENKEYSKKLCFLENGAIFLPEIPL